MVNLKDGYSNRSRSSNTTHMVKEIDPTLNTYIDDNKDRLRRIFDAGDSYLTEPIEEPAEINN